MVKGLILTERDKGVLYDCYQGGALTFRQLKARHFANNSTNTAYNRIQGLKRAGYIVSSRVGILLHKNEPQEIGVVYRPTQKSITTLSRLYPHEGFRDKPLRLNTASLPHDLLLVDVIHHLKERFPNQRIVRAGLYSGESLPVKRIPDAIVLDQNGKPSVAIELELTVKSKARYRQIVLHYRLSSVVKKVIYVVGSEAIAEKIRSQITPQKRIPGLAPPSTDRFYFVTLSEVLRSPLTVPITNGTAALGQDLQPTIPTTGGM